jgi:uncharacterized protein
MTEEDIVKLIQNDAWMMQILQSVEALKLKDWWIGAGFVRGKVWDNLHGFDKRTPIPDIDIIYFDKTAMPIEDEKKNWSLLKKQFPDIKWSVTNEAHRHIKLNRVPYKSSSEALSEWVETATCIGVRLENSKIILSTPWGIGDLTHLILRPTKQYENNLSVFYKRISDKEWLKKWPKLKIVT